MKDEWEDGEENVQFLKPYHRCLLIALIDFRARTTEAIIQVLRELGWVDSALIPEVIERELGEMKRLMLG